MRDDKLLLQDIIEAGSKIIRYTTSFTYENFLDDEKTRDAVVRNLEIIGEASSRVSASIQEQYTAIEWRRMKNFRNLLIRNYFGVNYTLVWDMSQNHLTSTLSHLQKIVQTL